MAMNEREGTDRDRGDDEEDEPMFRMGTITTMGDPELERRAQRLREEREDGA